MFLHFITALIDFITILCISVLALKSYRFLLIWFLLNPMDHDHDLFTTRRRDQHLYISFVFAVLPYSLLCKDMAGIPPYSHAVPHVIGLVRGKGGVGRVSDPMTAGLKITLCIGGHSARMCRIH